MLKYAITLSAIINFTTIDHKVPEYRAKLSIIGNTKRQPSRLNNQLELPA
jgi:hypothetical protein